MSRLTRIIVAMAAAFCCFVAATQAKAAPDGGYRVVKTEADAVFVEIGVGTTYWTLKPAFGEQFRKSTGFQLDSLEGFEALQALNPKTTIPVCVTPKDGPIYKGAGHLEVWASCPTAHKTLWLIAGLSIRIPLVETKVETFSARLTRFEAQDACFKSAECLANESKKLGGTIPASVVPSKTNPSASLDAAELAAVKMELADAKKKLESAPATVMATGPAPSSPPAWPFLGWGASLAILAFVAVRRDRTEKGNLARLREEHRKLNLVNEKLIAKCDAPHPADQELNLLANGFGVKTGRSAEAIRLQISENHKNLVEKQRVQEETLARLMRTMKDETKSLGVQVPEKTEIVPLFGIITQAHADAMKKSTDAYAGKNEAYDLINRRITDMNVMSAKIVSDKQVYAETEDALAPFFAELIEKDDRALEMGFLLGRKQRALASLTDGDPQKKGIVEHIAALEAGFAHNREERAKLMAHMETRLERYGQMHQVLTGRPAIALNALRLAQHDREAAATELSAAKETRETATQIRRETEAEQGRLNDARVSVEEDRRNLSIRHEKLVEDEKRLKAKETELKATHETLDSFQVRLIRAFADLVAFAGLDPTAQLEDIERVGGASGLGDLARERLTHLSEAEQLARVLEPQLTVAKHRVEELEENAQKHDQELVSVTAKLDDLRTVADEDRARYLVEAEALTNDNASKDARIVELEKQLSAANAPDSADASPVLEASSKRDDYPVVVVTESMPSETSARKTLRKLGGHPLSFDEHSNRTRSDWPAPGRRVNVRKVYELMEHIGEFMAEQRGKKFPLHAKTLPILVEFLHMPTDYPPDMLPNNIPEIDEALQGAQIWNVVPIEQLAEAKRKKTERPPGIQRT